MIHTTLDKTKSIFSVDVEDWFHILDVPSAPDISQWDSLPSRVEQNFIKLLDLFSEKDVKVTLFFLGYIARRFPGLVKKAYARGHEIASHGYAHKLIYQMTPDEFMEDSGISKKILEDLIGEEVLGFRSPGFSVTEATPWFYDKLYEVGYRYDSSVFPASREHGGFKTDNTGPHHVVSQAGKIIEFPITVTDFWGKRLCFFGGGYLRFFPGLLIKHMAYRVLKEKRPVIYYIHPREIDPQHPRLPMKLRRHFKSYVKLKSTEKKICSIFDEFDFITFRQFIWENRLLEEG